MNTLSMKHTFKHQGIPLFLQRILALVAVLIFSPMLLLVISAIILESKGGCFYGQIRVGRFGQYFTMYKFRSMYISSDPRFKQPSPTHSDRSGVCQKYKIDPRVSKVGRFIRKYSIDEIPQLWNVVIGEMALIGPRPALVKEVEQYSNNAFSRLNAKPGLSGLWQVSGRADTDFDTQVGLDICYIRTQSWWLDFKILVTTIPCVLLAKGAY